MQKKAKRKHNLRFSLRIDIMRLIFRRKDRKLCRNIIKLGRGSALYSGLSLYTLPTNL